jgi:hypothetical protein
MAKQRKTKTQSRSTKAETLRRIEQVADLILAGAELKDLREFALSSSDNPDDPKKSWNVSEYQLRRYMTGAYKIFAASVEKNRGRLLAKHIAQRHNLYARALAVGDLRAAMAVLRDVAVLQSVYPCKKLELGTPVALEITEVIVDSPGHAAAPAATEDRPGA